MPDVQAPSDGSTVVNHVPTSRKENIEQRKIKTLHIFSI